MRRISRVWLAFVFSLLLTLPASAEAWTVLGTHTVRTGETLFCIGRAYGVDPWAIATENRIVDVNLVHIGDVLAIPEAPRHLPPGPVCEPQFQVNLLAEGACPCRQQHTVTTGDTLSHISLWYDVDMQRIADCNHIENLDLIYIGDTLCIP